MGVKEILEFVKVEHTLFSLPFILIGAFMAGEPGPVQLFWILVAAVGARGLAMGLNRIIDRDIDAANPRTAERHLATGTMSLDTAWRLCGIFLTMLVGGAWMLNPLCLYLSPIPVAAFVVYPYLKRHTWLCHWWLGVCLALGPAGGWVAITGEISSLSWCPDLLKVSIGVMLWIAAFDIGYARMDVESDRENGIQSIPARFGTGTAGWVTVMCSTLFWHYLFQPISLSASFVAGILAILVLFTWNRDDFQKWWFRTYVAIGWIMFGGLVFL